MITAIERLAMNRIAAIGIAAVGATAASAQTLYVDDDAPPGGDGSIWATAYRFLQDAMADAAGGGITEIRVAQGTYTPDRDEANPGGPSDCCTPNSGTGCDDAGCQALVCAALPLCCTVEWDADCVAIAVDVCGGLCTDIREATFQLLNGVVLMGGYAGLSNPGDPDARNIALFETTLSGDLFGNDGPGAFENYEENAYSVVTGSGTDLTVLDGFTITHGNADGPLNGELEWVRGGGMWNLNGSPTITSCTFKDNSALRFGGGMYNRDQSSPTISDSIFSGNLSIVGGGGAVFNFDFSSPTFTNCEFSDNTAGSVGGGIRNFENCSPTVTGGMFNGNTATAGAGIHNEISCSPIVTNCKFIENQSTAGVAGGMSNGGDCSPTLSNCTFIGNTSTASGAALSIAFNSNPVITNCTIVGNIAQAAGGGIFITDALGGHSAPVVGNCIVRGNSDPQILAVNGAETTVTYSNVAGGWAGAGNIDTDPSFIDPRNGDYHLSAGSPSGDAGHNWLVPRDSADLDADADTSELMPLDLDGNPRFADDPAASDAGCGVPVVVDMGAYEYQGGPAGVVFADLDGDGVVGIVDFLMLLAAWGPCDENCCLADLDLDGAVGIVDFLILLGNWTA